MIEDLECPEAWWDEADPRRYKTVEVTDEEVTQAVTIMVGIRKKETKVWTAYIDFIVFIGSIT